MVDTYTLLEGLARQGPALYYRYILSGLVQVLRAVNTPKTAAYVEYIAPYKGQTMFSGKLIAVGVVFYVRTCGAGTRGHDDYNNAWDGMPAV